MRNSSDRYDTRLTCSCSKYWFVSFHDSIRRSRTLHGGAVGRSFSVGDVSLRCRRLRGRKYRCASTCSLSSDTTALGITLGTARIEQLAQTLAAIRTRARRPAGRRHTLETPAPVRRRQVRLEVIKVEARRRQRVLDVVGDGALDGVHVCVGGWARQTREGNTRER